MKVIGTTGDGGYIAEVSHTEVEKVFDKYYGKLDKLKPGDSVDLSTGYAFNAQIQQTCRDMTAAMKSFERSRDTLLRFANMVNNLEPTNGNE